MIQGGHVARRVSVRAKFIAMLAVAAACPLIIGLVSLHVLGHRYFISRKGNLYHSIAEHLAETLDQGLLGSVNLMRGWARFSQLGEAVHVLENSPIIPSADGGTGAVIVALEQRWPALPESDPIVAFALTNSVAKRIRAFQQCDPLYVELLVTDRWGRLIAASNKTTDFWQADERWWQRAVQLPPYAAWVEGIHFDHSAGVHSLDVSVALYGSSPGDTNLVSVAKGVLDVSPFLRSLRSERFEEHPARLVVMGDGVIVTALSGAQVKPFSESIGPAALAKLVELKRGSAVVDTPKGKRLMGFAPLGHLGAESIGDVEGGQNTYVVVSDDMASILRPLNWHLLRLSLAGVGVVVLFSLVGLVLANRGIVTPIRILQHAAGSISQSARLSADSRDSRATDALAPIGQKDVRRAVERLRHIRSLDEFGDLARDFQLMADRVLRYHEQLEQELQSRTEEMQGDLIVAREFQEAMLPRIYPAIPQPPGSDVVELSFHHVYRPALSVGGDFFDVLRLSPHQAGVFIADVMGHGARSALITAILRTLLQNISSVEMSPAALLARMNVSFCEMLPVDLDAVFATAAYMILDTHRLLVTYAVAGHPAPWFIRRSERIVEPLPVTGGAAGPAFGLLRDVMYEETAREFRPGDMFLLFTDGVTEAPDPSGEEFGCDRLQRVLEANMDLDAAGLLDSVADALHAHMSTVVSPDDICLVSVDVLPVTTP